MATIYDIENDLQKVFTRALWERYDERREDTKDGGKGEHIWGLDAEILQAFNAYMTNRFNGDALLAIANAEHYDGDIIERIQKLAKDYHDNLAINGEFVLRSEYKEQYSNKEKATYWTPNYYIMKWGVRVNGKLI